MANPFADIEVDASAEGERDVVGGYSVPDTDYYHGTIAMAYAVKSNTAGSKSQGVALKIKMVNEEGQEHDYRETIYVSGKDGRNYYEREENGQKKKITLHGFNMMEAICMLTTKKGLREQNVEEKVIQVYDYDQRKELPSTQNVFVDLLGQQIGLGIYKEIVDKTKQNPTTGKFDPTGDTREQAVIDRVFHPDTKQTLTEARNQKEATLFHEWVEKSRGKVRNKSKGGSQGGTAGAPGGARGGRGGASNAAAGGTPDLFNKGS